jgi:quercetin dioxygenase-like cupin family protein
MVSPNTGETFHFLQTSADTDGRLLEVHMTAAPGGGAKAVPVHTHPNAEERFYVEQGTLSYIFNGERGTAGPGESLIVPAGTPHTWYNASPSEDLVFRVELEPALEMEILFESLCGAGQAGVVTEAGVSPFMMAVALRNYPGNIQIASIPMWLQGPLMAVMAFIGERVMGFKPFYPYVAERAHRASVL